MRKLNYILTIFSLMYFLFFSGCDLDIENPNAPTEEQVLSTSEGLKAVAIGMQGRLGNAMGEAVFISGLVSAEIGTTNASLSEHREFRNYSISSSNTRIEDNNNSLLPFWNRMYAVIKSADDVINNVNNVQFEPGTRSGLMALAKLYKALSFTILLQNFNQVAFPQTNQNSNFLSREEIIEYSLNLLNEASTEITNTPVSNEFNNEILAKNFDLINTINAVKARLALIKGDYNNAVTFADNVNINSTSELVFNSVDPNPINNLFVKLGYFAPLKKFRDNAEPGDIRVDKFTTSNVIVGFGGDTLNAMNIYLSESDPIPVYTINEMKLIKAESYARLNDLTNAINLINEVRTSADLPAKNSTELDTPEKTLDEILKQRYYELFLTGQYWETLRRFNKFNEAKVVWLPYPITERTSNPNTPPNP